MIIETDEKIPTTTSQHRNEILLLFHLSNISLKI